MRRSGSAAQWDSWLCARGWERGRRRGRVWSLRGDGGRARGCRKERAGRYAGKRGRGRGEWRYRLARLICMTVLRFEWMLCRSLVFPGVDGVCKGVVGYSWSRRDKIRLRLRFGFKWPAWKRVNDEES